jgi:hypothetical protein
MKRGGMGRNGSPRREFYFSAILTLVGVGLVAAAPATAATASARKPLQHMSAIVTDHGQSETLPVMNPETLPTCPPPAPQKQHLSIQNALFAPSAARCKVIPANVGVNIRGINGHQYLFVGPKLFSILATAGRLAHRSQRVTPSAFTHSQLLDVSPGLTSQPCTDGGYFPIGEETICQNGQALPVGYDITRRVAVAAGLYAQTPTLFGYSSVYNWVGMQNDVVGANLAQIGIEYNNTSVLGTLLCKGNNDVNYRNFILTQIAVNGTYSTPICYPAYIFGNGTLTLFEVSWSVSNAKNYWTLWVNWNNVWEALGTYQIQDMYPSNAQPDILPAEVFYYTSTYTIPSLPSIPDADGQIDNNNTWEWWTSSLVPDTGYVQEDYCVSWPIRFTNVTVKDPSC